MARGQLNEDKPVQCESNPTGVNGVVVYDDVSYPILSVQAACVVDVAGASRWIADGGRIDNVGLVLQMLLLLMICTTLNS
ncbi:hypothetical protein OJAV_G00173020 [Oryzias javanicus]|uniref:Uncharacterized protein n=1 Tax=Oryzias javanicus TaxID=123683 RepID=A0A3S2MLC5_ORYJA|nr:hypothetical protein OJAV_G00173020 [Oryzias javanicus]